MQAFELETPEEEPFFGHQQSEGGIGDLITRYNLFGQSSHDDYYRGRNNARNSSSAFHEILKSSFFQKSLLGLIGLAVLIHLAFDSEGGASGEWTESSYADEEFVLAQSTAAPQEMHYEKANQGSSSTHISMHPPDILGAAPHLSTPPLDGKANQDLPQHKVPPAHSFTFGGMNNKGHNHDLDPPPETIKETLEEEILEDAIEFKGPWDISVENMINDAGHYLHDAEKSPFASHLYRHENDDELEKRQAEFQTKIKAIKDEFGEWTDPPEEHVSGQINFEHHVFGDVFFEDLLKDNTCWQMDRDYIVDFLDQAQALLEATKEGIMLEYGHPNPDDEEKTPFDVIIGDHHEVLDGTAVHHEYLEPLHGVAYLPRNSWDGLVRKLLHAMISEDLFYVVVAGRADTYGANNLAQSQVMQFNYIMEPIFHKLGMTLISRNMGMDASTAVGALAGADCYGEVDVLWHIQDAEAEEKYGEFDLLHRQMVLSGERVPIVLSSNTDELTLASKGKAWVGNLQPGAGMCQGSGKDVPACRNIDCTQDSDNCNLYNSVCWEPRQDWNPDDQLDQVNSPVKENPGYRQHQLEGRKMTLLLLHALKSALTLWRQEFNESNQPPLPSASWHVLDAYSDIRKSIMTLNDRAPGEANGFSASCELLMKGLDPRICHIPMHAFTEWTPRVVPGSHSLSAITNNLIDVSEDLTEAEPYVGPDILPLSWQIAPDEIDVHMIAIAANASSYLRGIEMFNDMVLGDDDGYRRSLSFSGAGIRKNTRYAAMANENSEMDNTKQFEGPGEWGSGWRLVDAPAGFCDGSAQARCSRTKHNNCLLANHQHYKGSLVGSSKHGWLSMGLYGVRHGIILGRLEFDKNGESPNDLVFDYAVNGVVKSIPKLELESFGKTIVEGLTVYPFLLEKDMDVTRSADDMKYEVAIRLRSEDDPDHEVRLSHLYFA